MSALLALIPRWMLLAAVAALLALAGLQSVRLSVSRSDAAAAHIEAADLRTAIADANTRAALQKAELSNQILKAQDESKIREAALRSAAAAAGSESDGLRGDLEAMRVQLGGLSRDAAVERAVAVGVVLTQCSARYTELAGKADRHASDVRTLMDAWPRVSAPAP